MNGTWREVPIVQTTGTVHLLQTRSGLTVWGIVTERGTYIPLSGLNLAYQSNGLRVRIAGELRTDIVSPISGDTPIQLTSIARQ